MIQSLFVNRPYIGRYAPSPTGPLHAGSMATALASWLDARAHGGRWLLRIEDVDQPRCVPGMDHVIAEQLAACGLQPDEPPVVQSTRDEAYADALQKLRELGWVYPCGCTRQDVELALAAHGTPHQRGTDLIYPGTCRHGLHGKPARAWRVRTVAPDGADIHIDWHDRRLGLQQQNLAQAVGDFVLRRADQLWAYQLAVVVDDAAAGVTDVVRGADLADNTARQIHLQRLLGLPQPCYWHGPLVLAADGQKLSKQTGAQAVNAQQPLRALNDAAQVLGLPALPGATTGDWLAAAVQAWYGLWGLAPASSDAPGQSHRA